MESPVKQERRGSKLEDSWEETPNRISSSSEYIRSTSPEAKNPIVSPTGPSFGDPTAITLFPSAEEDEASSSMMVAPPAPAVALFPSTNDSEVYRPISSDSPNPYLKLIKEKKVPQTRSKKGHKGKSGKRGDDEGISAKMFTEIAKKNLETWRIGEAGGIQAMVLDEKVTLAADFWDMSTSSLVFQHLNSKFRHCLHEVCEELNLSHESSGSQTDRVVTVSREQVASGHDLSRATYGCQYYNFDVPKQKTISKVLTMDKATLEEIENSIDYAREFEARDDLCVGGRTLFSLKQYPNYDENRVTLVDNEEDLKAVCEGTLKGQKRIGFDLEWHSYRSYKGVTCTIQLCVEGAVVIIDALSCFNSISEHLGPFFEDASIIKCGLCIDQDVAFLFRDFGIVSRGAVDLQKHAALLHADQNLGYVAVLKLCECNKEIVTTLEGHKETTRNTDWRLRPLSRDMRYYAGADCYYLLPCLDVISSRLMEEFGYVPKDTIHRTAAMVRGSVQSALKASQFSVTQWRSNKFYKQYTAAAQKAKKKNGGKTPKKKDGAFAGRNEHVLSELYAWREIEAFECDESLHYIASPKLLFVTSLRLPETVDELLELITSTDGIDYPEKDLALTAPVGILSKDLPSPSLEARKRACLPLLMKTNEAVESYGTNEKPVSMNQMNNKDRETGSGRRRAWAIKISVAIATVAVLKIQGRI